MSFVFTTLIHLSVKIVPVSNVWPMEFACPSTPQPGRQQTDQSFLQCGVV